MVLTDHRAEFEKALQEEKKYVLRLYVIENDILSQKAIENLRIICEKYLPGNFSLDIIDISKNPQLAKDEQIIAIPTLIKKLPKPLKRMAGELSNFEKVLVGMDLKIDHNNNFSAE